MPSSPSTVPAAANQDNNSSSHTKVSAIPATDNRNSLNNLNTFISNSSSATAPVPAVGTVLFHYHVGSLYGLATAARRLCATVGDDKQLMLWDVVDCELLAKTTLKASRATLVHMKYFLLYLAVRDGFRIRRGAATLTRASPSSR